jgi:hypothetical protein
MTTDRPVGVSVLAVVYFIAVASYAVLLVTFLGSPQTLNGWLTTISPEGVGPSMLLNLGRALTIYFAIMIIVIGAVAWGMWTLKNWSRWFTIVITAISLAVTLIGISSLASSFTIVGLCLELVRIGLCVLILWYLFTPTIRRAFAG